MVKFSGTYASANGLAIKGIEANKNFYLTNVTGGPLKLSAYNTTPGASGVPAALDGTGILAGAGSGFLVAASQCAYQIVFGYTDVNGNLLLGSPSQRILVVNSTAGSDNVTLTFTVPQGLTTSYFYQVYRTIQTTYSATPSLNVPPGAEPQLSAQYNLSGGQISALSVTLTDVTTDALLGASLYTNPSQQGALQQNLQPPYSTDMCLFSQMTFYSNCYTLQTLFTNLISEGAPNGIQIFDTVTVNGVVFTGEAAQLNSSQQFAVYNAGSIAQNIDTTARNLVACVNANASMTHVYAYYISGYNSLPGQIQFQAISITTGSFTVTTSRLTAFSPTLPTTSTNDSVPNGIFISKIGQPEAVPSFNIQFVGGGDQPIYRVLALRDRVIVLKSDGVFVITGSTPQNLSITLLDSTIICIAPDSARVLNNSVYCLSQQGVVSITESGVTIQSRSVESDILSFTTKTYGSAFATLCNAVIYESERLYILNLPTNVTDTYPTQSYCYNWVTNVWTRWTLGISSGLVNPFNNLLYICQPVNGDYLYQERKNYSFSDYVDDELPVTITAVTPTSMGAVITLAGGSGISSSWVGRGLLQFQILQFFTTSGTFQINTFGSTITVQCIGGGAGDTITGAGGGGGEYRKSILTYASGSPIAITVGAGGAGSANGGASSFGSAVIANGGTSGPNGGAGGTGGTGTIGNNGGAGTAGLFQEGGGGGAGGPLGVGGAGGGSTVPGSGGGGGNGGGQAGNSSTNVGGAGHGGDNFSGSGGGAAAGFGLPGQPGTNGGGGGGGFIGFGSFLSGGKGGDGTDISLIYGSGGGGGGGGTSGPSFAGNGGNYGGGGGGSGGLIEVDSSGANGLVAVIYTAQVPNMAVIDSVNVGANQITVDLTNSSSPGVQVNWGISGGFIGTPIPITYQQSPITGNFPHFVKEWGRMNYWFNGGNFQTITAGVQTDFITPGNITQTLSANIPAQMQTGNFPMTVQTISTIGMGRWVMPFLSLAIPLARFSCCGVTSSYEIVSDVSA